MASTTFSFYYLAALLKANSNYQTLSYLSTSKMYGTDLGSSYWPGATHTCNYIQNSANPKGDAYIIVTLPFYLEIKEIYNMGDK